MFRKLQKIYFLSKNLLLVTMFMWNFTHLIFFLKDRISKKILHHGLSRNGLYH
jgi:hypothetical protein